MDIIDYKRSWEQLKIRAEEECRDARGKRQERWKKAMTAIQESIDFLELPAALETMALEQYKAAVKEDRNPPSVYDDPRLNWARVQKIAESEIKVSSGSRRNLWIAFHQTVVALNDSIKDFSKLEKESSKAYREASNNKDIHAPPKLRIVSGD